MLLYRVLYDIYFHLRRMNRAKHIKPIAAIYKRLSDTFSYYFSVLLNQKYPLYFKKHPVKNGLNKKKRDEKYIFSLTSFPARIEKVWLAIETLMRQTEKADMIILWLAEEQFPDKKLPESLISLMDKGLSIRFCDDIKSHKKYYYAFQEFPDANIITVDDDMFHPTDMLKKLIRYHKKHPSDVIAISAQIISPSLDSMPTLWRGTQNHEKLIHSLYVQAYTGAGALFPPKWYPDEVFNINSIKETTWTCDDLWLKAMEILSGTMTTKIKTHRAFAIQIVIEKNETLYNLNLPYGENLNNKSWEALNQKYELMRFENK